MDEIIHDYVGLNELDLRVEKLEDGRIRLTLTLGGVYSVVTRRETFLDLVSQLIIAREKELAHLMSGGAKK